MMEDLPIEMINEILVRLDKPSLFYASNVCKLWRQQSLLYVMSINSKEELECRHYMWWLRRTRTQSPTQVYR